MPPTKSLSNADIIRLLELYRVEYDCVIPDDHEQDVTLQKIASAMNIKGLGPKEVADKFKHLKQVYLEELKKVEDSKASGADALSVYVPSVYWFPTMQALLGSHNKTQTSRTCIPGPMKREENFNDDDPDDPPARDSELFSDGESVILCGQTSVGRGNHTLRLNRESCGSPKELELPAVPERPAGVMADTLDHFGRYLASILRELPHHRSFSLQRTFINEAISARQTYVMPDLPSPPRNASGASHTTVVVPDTAVTIDCSETSETEHCPDTPSGTSPARNKRKRRRRSPPLETTATSNEPPSTIFIKEEISDCMETETPELPATTEQEPSRTEDDAASIDIEEEVKREYNGSGYEVIRGSESDCSQSVPASTTRKRQTENSIDSVQQPQKKNGKFTCDMCSIRFPNYGEFWKHAKEKHADTSVAATLDLRRSEVALDSDIERPDEEGSRKKLRFITNSFDEDSVGEVQILNPRTLEGQVPCPASPIATPPSPDKNVVATPEPISTQSTATVTNETISQAIIMLQNTITGISTKLIHLEDSLAVCRRTNACERSENDNNDESSLLSKFPLKSLDSFMELEEDFKASPTLKNKCVKIAISVGGRDCKQHTLNLMKRFMSNELSVKFSYTGKKGYLEEKTISFYDKELCLVIHDAIKKSFSDATDAVIKKYIMGFLNQAKTRINRSCREQESGGEESFSSQ